MADGYEPRHRMRVSMTGMLRNAAEELQAVFNRNERTRAEHAEGRDEDDECDCHVCSETDWTAYYAAGLSELADNAAQLDADPAQLFEFADLYALHGIAAAHYSPIEEVAPKDSAQQ